MKELIAIQAELKAPKDQTNDFGKYKYRSCEDILEAVKPLCCKHNCLLTLSDEMIMLGERFYVKATATICLADVQEVLHFNKESVSAYARESETKKGMDASQITGSASSYARKNALNGLFCIDDTKDADTMDNSLIDHQKPKKATERQKAFMKDYLHQFRELSDVKAIDYIEDALVNDSLTKVDAETIIGHCRAKLGK